MSFRFFLTTLVLTTCGALFVLPMLGKTAAGPLANESVFDPIYLLRFHRSLLAMIAGGGLALAGLVFQALFRNPLATPYTLGVASGASFGAAVFLRSGVHFGLPIVAGSLAGVSWVSFGAFAGAMLAMSVVFFLARAKDASSEQMILAGVAVNFFFSSLIVLLQYISAPHDAMQMLRWTMGGVQNAVAGDCLRLGPVVATVFVLLFFFSRELNIVVTGKERARSLGVDVSRLRTILFATISIMIGAVVSVTGPIGFVGLMVPHLGRMLVGPNHRRLVPVTFFGGALFLAVCDTLGRSLFYPAEFPAGIVTSLLGGPFFLWLLLRSERRLG